MLFKVFLLNICLYSVIFAQTHEDLIFNADQLSPDFGIGFITMSGHDSYKLHRREKNWDQSERYEIMFKYRMAEQRNRDIYMGFYIFWEDREETDNNVSTLSYDALGIGVETGATIYPFESLHKDDITLGFTPYFRAGIATQDALLNDYVDADGTSEADTGSSRFELGVGIDATLRLRNIELGAGVGAMYWNSGDLDITTTDSFSAVTRRAVDFNGDFVYYKFSVAISF